MLSFSKYVLTAAILASVVISVQFPSREKLYKVAHRLIDIIDDIAEDRRGSWTAYTVVDGIFELSSWS